MARYTFRESGGRPDAPSVALDLDVAPPHDLPALLALRRNASDLLRDDPRFAAATRIDVVYGDGDGEPVATVDRAYLSLTGAPVPVGGGV
jgi:hypothetical protein